MSSAVENLAEETAKMAINEKKFDTNWCDLSAKLKNRCIEHLELKERLLLRSTSKIEQGLVDSQKTKVPFLKFQVWHNSSTISFGKNLLPDSRTLLKFPKNENFVSTISTFQRLLKLADFETLIIDFEREKILSDDFPREPLSVKTLELESCSKKDQFFFLEILNAEGVTMIKFNADEEDACHFNELLKIPKVTNCPFWQVSHLYRSDSAARLAQIWIEKDAEIGKTFQVCAMKHGTVNEFRDQFKDRIVSKSPKLTRIRTNDPTKHIVLELGLDDSYQWDNIEALQFLRLLVISSELNEDTEYNWKTNDWMNILAPEYYFPGERWGGYDSDSSDSDSDTEMWNYDYYKFVQL